MQVPLFPVLLVPASKCGPAGPGMRFFLWPISANAAAIHSAERVLRQLHRLRQYHLDHRSMLPSETDLCLHKKAAGYKQEQSREKGPQSPEGGFFGRVF